MKKIQDYYEGMYYVLYALNIRLFGENDIPHFNIVCWFTVFQFFWILNFHILYTGLFELYLVMPSNPVIIATMSLIGIANGFYFLKGKYYLKIRKRLEQEEPAELRKYKVAVTLIACTTIVTGLFLVWFFLTPT